MNNIKVDELTGYKLNYYVAIASNIECFCKYIISNEVVDRLPLVKLEVMVFVNETWRLYSPIEDWSIAGKIIEDNDISIEVAYFTDIGKCYIASTITERNLPTWKYYESRSTTMLEAAMRCFVKSKLGDEVDDI